MELKLGFHRAFLLLKIIMDLGLIIQTVTKITISFYRLVLFMIRAFRKILKDLLNQNFYFSLLFNMMEEAFIA